MNTPFSRSIRILDADKFRPSLLVIGLSVVILVGWLLWFFLAKVTLMEVGKIVSIGNTGEVQTEFTGQNAQRVRVGQEGWLRIDGETGQELGLVPVVVVRRRAVSDTRWQVDLMVVDERIFTVPLGEVQIGQVQVAVERVSPAALLLRASGQVAGSPRVSTSP